MGLLELRKPPVLRMMLRKLRKHQIPKPKKIRLPQKSAAKKEAKEMKKDPMANMGRAERVSRDSYDHAAKEVVNTLNNSMSDKAASHAAATAEDAAKTAGDL